METNISKLLFPCEETLVFHSSCRAGSHIFRRLRPSPAAPHTSLFVVRCWFCLPLLLPLPLHTFSKKGLMRNMFFLLNTFVFLWKRLGRSRSSTSHKRNSVNSFRPRVESLFVFARYHTFSPENVCLHVETRATDKAAHRYCAVAVVVVVAAAAVVVVVVGCWLLVVGCWLLVVGCWLLVVGCWLLVVGCWLLVVGCWLLVVGCWLLVVGCWLLVVGCWLLVVGCWLLVVGCWLLVVGCWLLVVGCWLLVVGCWLLVVGCWLLVVGCWLLVVGCWLLVVGCWLLVVGCWLLVVGCWLLVVGCWLLVVGCWLLAVDCWLLLVVGRCWKQTFLKNSFLFVFSPCSGMAHGTPDGVPL